MKSSVAFFRGALIKVQISALDTVRLNGYTICNTQQEVKNV